MSINPPVRPQAKPPTDFAIQEFGGVSIKIASPDKINDWSYGEVKKPETINYRTSKPERDGLFCEKIFGPSKDLECSCGRYKNIRFQGITCDHCKVEVTTSKVRRVRMGHIKLVVPVAHIWYLKGAPARIATLLEMKPKEVESVVYYENYVVLNPGTAATSKSKEKRDKFRKKNVITISGESEIKKLKNEFGKSFEVGIGAEAMKKLLEEIDPGELVKKTKVDLKKARAVQKKKQLSKLFEMSAAMQRSGVRPEWMVMDVVPVIPPDLRPMVQLEGGRFATSDINDLYRRLINRNNRLKRLIEHKAPDIIIKNEKRMLQEAVDALLDNGQHGRVVRGVGNRPLKSLTDLLKGKQGRFRQNLLGKRVDYSGRAVIVIGPELRINQCGLPKRMALELFKPFVMGRMMEKGLVHNIKGAKKKIEVESPEVWDALEEVIEGRPVLLNRAPTLHRLGIQGFEPVLIEGKAIRLHPLVCTAFNADFDGDQMAVHVPLSLMAKIEARLLMLSTNNMFSPASGKCIAAPTQDIVLGCHYLTRPYISDGRARNDKEQNERADRINRLKFKILTDAGLHSLSAEERRFLEEDLFEGHHRVYRSSDEVVLNLQDGNIDLHDWIIVHAEKIETLEDRKEPVRKLHLTTPGRVIFNDVLPADWPYENVTMTKKYIGNMVSELLAMKSGKESQSLLDMLDSIKRLGYKYATRMGCSIGYFDDLVVPPRKAEILEKAEREVEGFRKQYESGKTSKEELHNRSIDIWSRVTRNVTDAMVEDLEKDKNGFNPVYMMTFSGARGNIDQARQLAGIRGLMAKPSGEIIELPIKSNFKEGLSVLEYFISTHGARKGLADTALKTADAGYLTRRLVDVAQEIVVEPHPVPDAQADEKSSDCRTQDGIYARAMREGEELIQSLAERICGRVLQEDVIHQDTGEVLAKANTLVDEKLAKKIEDAGVEKVFIRSVLTCESRRGVCQLCYGRNLATRKLVDIGEAVGIIGAQSIGEPGTQLTMRTFHIGGVAMAGASLELKLGYDVLITDYPEKTIPRREEGRELHIVVRDGRLGARKVKKSFDTREVDPKAFEGVWVKKGDIVGLSKSEKGKEIHAIEEGVVYLRENKILIMGAEEFHDIKIGTRLRVGADAYVSADTIIAEFDPYNDMILTEYEGVAHYREIVKGRTTKEIVDETTKKRRNESVEDREKKLIPCVDIEIPGEDRFVTYDLPYGCILEVSDEQKVKPGDVLAKIPREGSKTKDITGGLPRVEELFEARGKTPRDAFISAIDGVVGIEPKKIQLFLKSKGEEKLYEIRVDRYNMKVRDRESVKKGHVLATSDNAREFPNIVAAGDGVVNYEAKDTRVTITHPKTGAQKEYGVPMDRYSIQVREGDRVHKGDALTTATDSGDVISTDIDGVVTFFERKFRKIIITEPETGVKREYEIPVGRHLKVRDGDRVRKAQPLTDGPVNPHDMLEVEDLKGIAQYLVKEVQEVYRRQGVDINDKHIEVIVRQMLRKVEIDKDPGDSEFSIGTLVDRFVLKDVNERLIQQGKKPASFKAVLLGITRASLVTDSFISAASFQETRRVLTDASIKGEVDKLRGLKENVIIGNLIPAGTGLKNYRTLTDVKDVDPEKILAKFRATVPAAPVEKPAPAPEQPVAAE